jgi:heparanase 1
MMSRARGALVAATLAAAVASSLPVAVMIDTAALPLSLPPNYLGYTLDWWPPRQEDFGTSTVNMIAFDNPRLAGLARALGPATLRVGGSLDNVVKYLVGGMPRAECEAPVPFRGQVFPNLCLNLTRAAALLSFVDRALAPGSSLVFGLQLNLGPAGWNATNVLDFIAALAQLPGARVLEAVEVGEETNPAPNTTDFAALAAAYAGVRAAVRARAWPRGAPPLVLGPCSGMNENVAPFAWDRAFLASAGGAALDAYVMHSYNNDGGDGWRVPGFLAQTAAQASGVRGMLDAAAPAAPLPLWCGECGPHNGGGLVNVTTRAISSFWYTDALLSLPLLGVTRFNRQTLAGGSYGLLANDDFAPRPDYFAALAYATLAGARVLRAHASPNVSAQLHVFARCAPGGAGGVTVAWVNVDAAASFALTMSGVAVAGSKTVYSFAPRGGDALADTLLLNGVPLVVAGNAPPPLVGAASAAGDPVAVPPASFGYAVFPSAGAAACA